jgi:hypothetical protein
MEEEIPGVGGNQRNSKLGASGRHRSCRLAPTTKSNASEELLGLGSVVRERAGIEHAALVAAKRMVVCLVCQANGTG